MGTTSTLIWVGGLVAAGGVAWYLYSKGYFDSIISTVTGALEGHGDTGTDDKDKEDDKEEDKEEEEETPKCKSGEEYDEKKKKCVKKSNLAVAYLGQQGAFRAYKTYRY